MNLLSSSKIILLIISAGILFLVVYITSSNRSTPNKSPEFSKNQQGHYKIPLEQYHNTEASGEVTLEPYSDTVDVSLRARNLESNSPLNVHFHKGSCEKGGGGGFQLESLKPNERTSWRSHTTVQFKKINPTYDHMIMIHNHEGRHILCTDIPSINFLRESPDK